MLELEIVIYARLFRTFLVPSGEGRNEKKLKGLLWLFSDKNGRFLSRISGI